MSLEERWKYALVWISGAQQRMSPTSSFSYPQLNNNPLVHLRNSPQMEPRIMKTVNELNNAPLELISSQHTPLGIYDR